MIRIFLRTATAVGLLISPAIAQDSGSAASESEPLPQAETSSPENDALARENAQRRAEEAGFDDVAVVDRAFVLQGVNAAGNEVFFIVNPPGALIGIGGPMDTSADKRSSTGTEAAANSSGEEVEGDRTTSNELNTPQPGEPASSGYMATQVSPPGAQVWEQSDAMLEELWSAEVLGSAMTRMGLDRPSQ
ncbi:hypothetical protein VQ042_19210 [Aurantimonas sp. A2-1-M11]|uniref:hypothetical protein n=1 Tax=Aurantimonas sp. A2-1-M11 TaxID=3113712 RepID=UPI002F92EB00